MDFEEQWKEEFMRNYLDNLKKDNGNPHKAPLNILQVLKRKIWK